MDPRQSPSFASRSPIRLRRLLPGGVATIRRGVAEVDAIAERVGLSPEARTDIEISLREALANAWLHGNGGDEGRPIFLRCYGSPTVGLLIAVRDDGSGFDPGAVPDPRAAGRTDLSHGRGLLLMRELLDHVEYRRGGSEVLLFKSVR